MHLWSKTKEKLKACNTEMKNHQLNIKPLLTLIYNSQEVCLSLFLLKLHPKLREKGYSSGKVQNFIDTFSKQIYLKS